LILGILIFQDILAVPMLLLVPVLAGAGEELDGHHLLNFAKGTGMLLFVAFMAYRFVPKLLYYVTRTRNRELFLLSVLTICFAVAWITSSIGLSLSLGAFLAGLIVSESEYSDEAVGNVFPFQAIFTSFFFVSMGMLLDMAFVIQQPLLILIIAVVVILAKFLVAGSTALILGVPLRSAVLAGIGLAQVGEFSFVIAQGGMGFGIMTDYQYQLFLAVSLLTMAVTPTMMALSHQLALVLGKLPIPQKIKNGFNYTSDDGGHHKLENHIIIAGFGLRGRHLARVAKETDIPYVVLEMNPETVKKEKKKGEPIRYGDPSHHSVLQHAGIKAARILAVVINDPVAAIRIIKMAKELNPNVYVITRTRYFQEAQPLFRIGADDVIPDELGSSLEIFARVLQKCDVAHDQIANCVHTLRLEGYEALHLNSSDYSAPASLPFESSEARIETFNIMPGTPLAGKTLAESELRKMHGLTVLVIKRQNQTMTTLGADTQLQDGDNVVVIGAPDNLIQAKNLFQVVPS
jgi:CPA2 family monovalent cation:H+ antiporter-2